MKIGCILVLYNPDWHITNKSISSIIDQVSSIYILDNSKVCTLAKEYKNSEKIIYHEMGGNKGIAAAQNVGMEYYVKHRYDYILYLDQDSIVEPNMVSCLLRQYTYLKQLGKKVGGIGPRPFNRLENKEYRGCIKKGKAITDKITEVTELISSATLVPISVIKEVGYMETQLFIDGVDHEWCWRASFFFNYHFYIDEEVKLSHQLGEGDRFFLFKRITIPTPFRTYYRYRNYFILIRRNYVPLYWKLSNGFKYFIKIFYYPMMVSPRLQYLKNILGGIKAGLIYKYSN